MIILIITIYLLIGAIIGLRDSEMIEAICKKEDDERNLSKKMTVATNIIVVLGIILTVPIVELINKIKSIKSR